MILQRLRRVIVDHYHYHNNDKSTAHNSHINNKMNATIIKSKLHYSEGFGHHSQCFRKLRLRRMTAKGANKEDSFSNKFRLSNLLLNCHILTLLSTPVDTLMLSPLPIHTAFGFLPLSEERVFTILE